MDSTSAGGNRGILVEIDKELLTKILHIPEGKEIEAVEWSPFCRCLYVMVTGPDCPKTARGCAPFAITPIIKVIHVEGQPDVWDWDWSRLSEKP